MIIDPLIFLLAGPFSGLALYADGVDSKTNEINICKRCYTSLKNHRTPHLAVANNLDFGTIPFELLDMNWAEERVISLYRISVHVLNLRGTESPSHRDKDSLLHQQMKLKGHAFSVSQDAASVYNVLPVHPDELPDIIQVCLHFLRSKTYMYMYFWAIDRLYFSELDDQYPKLSNQFMR